MSELAFTSCARPTLGARKRSTYTVLGFTGYAIASLVGAVLATVWGLSLTERLIGFFVPPLAFIVVVTIASAVVGRERIVFYQTACAGVGTTAIVAAIAGARVERLVDLATLGIGVFLVFGRIGCFSVACCHGTPGRGVTYGPPHVSIGFWSRWIGRPLWPVQLVESAASLVLVAIALAVSGTPGTAALVYIEAYSVLRFGLELVRGDGVRPYFRGASEAQWLAAAITVACAIWRPSIVTAAVAAAIVAALAVLVALRPRRELLLPPHLRELDRAMSAADDGNKHATSLGLAVSRHALPDGRIDWILSSEHPAWSVARAQELAGLMWSAPCELVAGRTPGVVHVVVGTPTTGAATA
jgi:prolipoprotein diacylglyceryltransferase